MSRTHLNVPRISIGMPVFNGENALPRALDSLLQQSFPDFELIISDNGSTDATQGICEAYSMKDSRVKYTRQKFNRGALANFEFVFREACGKYFIWAASDDCWSTDFFQLNYDFLEANPEYVASICPVRMFGEVFNETLMGDCALDGDQGSRIHMCLANWHRNSRFYSLIRREILLDCPILSERFVGYDWAVAIYLAFRGKMHRTRSGELLRGPRGTSERQNIFKIYRTTAIERWIPFFFLSKFVCKLLKGTSAKVQILSIIRLTSLNVLALYAQTVFFIRQILRIGSQH